ncbi:MAG: hypothetical protein LQ338_002632 [Usnochroma carphineum]|nr:MAG: hypothetical protein LQ338_002632 [Usnochroma carphineum]
MPSSLVNDSPRTSPAAGFKQWDVEEDDMDRAHLLSIEEMGDSDFDDDKSAISRTSNSSEVDKLQTEGEEADNSDNDSVASDASDLSEMEPIESYKCKIEQLLSDVGLVGFSIEAIQHGYEYQNCVYALTSDENPNEQYILRVPLFPELRECDDKCEAIINDAVLLEYLQDKLPVPRVKAYSITKDNALNAPFTLQTRVPGISLSTIYDELNFTDKLVIVDQVVELLAKLESIQFPKAGTFAGCSSLPDQMSDLFTAAAPSINIFNEGDEEFTKDAWTIRDRAGDNVKSLLTSHLNGWIENDLNADEEDEYDSVTIPSLAILVRMVEELKDEGAFREESCPIVLHHWDLEPRNIMVENKNGAWKICGIIDWDDALALPRPLARRPPNWIWDFDQEGYTGYFDTDHHPTLVLSDDNLALKQHFDLKAAAALDGYLEDAYGSGQWFRRIWLFARRGFWKCWYLDLVKELEADWAERAKTKKPMALPIEEPISEVTRPIFSELEQCTGALSPADFEEQQAFYRKAHCLVQGLVLRYGREIAE